MESTVKRTSIIKNISYTYDNAQRLVKNSIESFKRFNEKTFPQKLKSLFIHKKATYLWSGFFIFGIVLAINVIIMTFYLVDSGYKYNLMNNSYINAVLPSQDINEVMDLGIVKVEKAKFLDLNVGDQVVIYEDFSLDVHFVETIVSIDNETGNIELTYDNVTTNDYHANDLIGKYAEKANFLGTIYYASTYTRGYLFIAMSHLLLLFGYWYVFLSRKEMNEIDYVASDYQEEQNILGGLVQEIALEQRTLDYKDIGILIPPVLDINNETPLERTKEAETVISVKAHDNIKSKGDIINYITLNTGLNNYKAKLFLKYFAEVIAEELSKGEYVHIVNFGKFSTVTMPAKTAMDPRSKKRIVVPEHKQARFKFYNEVKSKLE